MRMTDTNVVALMQPDQTAMTQHLEHLFGGFLDGCHDGMIELAWTNAGDGKLRHAEMFGTDDIEKIVARAAELNSVQGQNVYIGAALRKPGTFPGARGQDDDHYATTAFYVDLDDEGAADAVTGKYRGCKPTLAVVTGRKPHKRVQLWWRLETPERDPEAHRAQCKALQVALGGDETVVNPSRVMRLGGSIAWPRKDGRVTENTEVMLFPDRPLVMPGQLAKAYPPAQAELSPVPQQVVTETVPVVSTPSKPQPAVSPLTGRLRPSVLIDAVRSGNQWHNNMIRLVAHWVGRGWSDAEILGQAAGLTLPGYTERQTIQEMSQAIRGARAKWAKPNLEAEFDAETGEVVQPGGSKRQRVKILDLKAIDQLLPPAYVIDSLITETGFTLVYGATASFKSFLVLDWLLCMAYGEPWCGKEVLPKTVLYIAGEGVGGIKKRVKAWRIEHGKLDAEAPFYMLEHGINFTRSEDVQDLLAAAKQFSEETGQRFEMVAVDTVARAMVGAEEKDATAMGIFIDACDTVRRHFSCGLIAVHHTGKDKTLGARGSSALPAAVDTEVFVDRTEASMLMKIEVKKQKDDEEGAPMHFEAVKIDLPSGGVKPDSSLVLRSTEAPVEEAPRILSKAQVNELLKEVARAWNEGRPWSNSHMVKKDGRWFPRWICEHFGVGEHEAKEVLKDLLFNRFLDTGMANKKMKLVGLKVLKYHPGGGLDGGEYGGE
jgi:hypothetical protein